MIPLFDKEALYKKLNECASVEIEPGGILPSAICFPCAVKINEFYEFRELIRSSDVMLNTNSYDPEKIILKKYYSTENLQPTDDDIQKEEEKKLNFFELENKIKMCKISNEQITVPQKLIYRSSLTLPSAGKNLPKERDAKSNSTGAKSSQANRVKKQPKETSEHLCMTCNRLFTGGAYKKHLRTHCFICQECGKTFETKILLNIHKKVHIITPHSCHICSKVFRKSESLHKHLLSHKATTSTLHPCTICNRQLTLTHLKRHMKQHMKKPTYMCTYCNCGFFKKDRLLEHIRVHYAERPYACKICSEIFSYSIDLKNHGKTFHGIA